MSTINSVGTHNSEPFDWAELFGKIITMMLAVAVLSGVVILVWVFIAPIPTWLTTTCATCSVGGICGGGYFLFKLL